MDGYELTREDGEDKNDRINNLDNEVIKVEKRMDKMESSLHNTTNQSLHIIKALNDIIK